jgi:hypothetical protein
VNSGVIAIASRDTAFHQAEENIVLAAVTMEEQPPRRVKEDVTWDADLVGEYAEPLDQACIDYDRGCGYSLRFGRRWNSGDERCWRGPAGELLFPELGRIEAVLLVGAIFLSSRKLAGQIDHIHESQVIALQKGRARAMDALLRKSRISTHESKPHLCGTVACDEGKSNDGKSEFQKPNKSQIPNFNSAAVNEALKALQPESLGHCA